VSDETPVGSGPTDPEDTSEPAPEQRSAPGRVDMPRPTGSARVFASTIDLVLAGIFVYAAYLFIASAMGLLHKGTMTTDEQHRAALLSMGVLIGTALIFVLLERSGGSVGKRLSGLRTAGLNGSYPAPLGALVGKYLLIFALQLFGFFGAIAVMAGLLIPFWRQDRRNAFDLVSRLQVVPRSAVVPGADGAPAETDEGSSSAAADATGD
jgi:hypothetical protein